MAWTTPSTWIANALVTAAQMNQQVRDNAKRLRSPAQCSVFHNATQSIPNNNAVTALAFNSERYDRVDGAPSTMHDLVVNNSRVTPNDPGIYIIEAGISFAAQAVAAGIRGGFILLNGVTFIRGLTIPMTASYNNTQVDVPTLVRTWEFNGTTDFIQIVPFQTSGGALNVLASTGSQCDLTVTRIG